jgi:hypothetical protein
VPTTTTSSSTSTVSHYDAPDDDLVDHDLLELDLHVDLDLVDVLVDRLSSSTTLPPSATQFCAISTRARSTSASPAPARRRPRPGSTASR